MHTHSYSQDFLPFRNFYTEISCHCGEYGETGILYCAKGPRGGRGGEGAVVSSTPAAFLEGEYVSTLRDVS